MSTRRWIHSNCSCHIYAGLQFSTGQFGHRHVQVSMIVMSGFHGAFATGVASQQGTLTLPDTWFRPPFWDLLMLQLLRPNSSNLPCLYSTFHLEYPLVLSGFCLYIERKIFKVTKKCKKKCLHLLIKTNVRIKLDVD